MSVLALFFLCCLAIIIITFILLAKYIVRLKKNTHNLALQHNASEKKLELADQQADLLVKKALKDARELAIKERKDFDRIQREKQLELKKTEERLQAQQRQLELRLATCEKKEVEIKSKEALLNNEFKKSSELLKQAEATVIESKTKLEYVAQLTVQEAREQLRQSIEDEARKEAMIEIQKIEADVNRVAQERVQGILATAIQRIAGEFVADTTVSVITLPNDEMKGRIIGREGRNIRAIEQATGVDIIIDDTPEAIIISCFNPIRREIAKIAIERLIADGRIHPARIQEIVQKAQAEFDSNIFETGERVLFDFGIMGSSSELITALGKLKYMTTGGQSVLQHAVETAQIAAIIAQEIGIDTKLAQRAALFHDIGKGLPETTEGHHAKIGAEFLKKLGEAPEVVEAALKHHELDVQNVYVITIIVQAANALSQFRPGARKDYIQRGIERLSELEQTVETYDGVQKAYVIKSGRELRAMILPTVENDATMTGLAKKIAKRLRHESHQQNNSIKVTLIREQRATYLAK